MEFNAWLKKVDTFMYSVILIGRDDFPDQNYYDWFAEGFSPAEAVAMAIENEYGYNTACELGLGDYF